MNTHNGWTNYETWLVKLWQDNSEGDPQCWPITANAQFIVTACNNHQALVEACKGALFALGECSVGREKLSDLFPHKVEALRAVLAKITP